MSIQQERFLEIADAIREKTGETELIKPSAFAEKVSDVYESGTKAEWSAFWDAYQENGTRTDYSVAFIKTFWNHENLKPKYDIRPTNANQMFYMLGYGVDGLTFNLKDLFATAGVELDFSQVTNMNYCFQTSKVTHLGVIDLRGCGSKLDNTFGNTYNMQEIEKVIVCETNTFPSTFSQCWATKIMFEGVVASNLTLGQLRCDKANFENIIGVLSDSVTGKTLTLNLSAVKKAFETSSGANDGNTSAGWETLVATKSNWTITLV